MTTRVILRGADAVNYAEEHRIPVRLGDPGDPQGSTAVDLEEARRMVEREPARVWVEVERAVNTGGDNTGPYD